MFLRRKFGIKSNERVLIVGRTGTGKTYLAKHLVREYKNVVALDTKGTLSIPNFVLVREPRNLHRIAKNSNVVFRTPWRWSNEEFDNFFLWCIERGETIVYIDELYRVASEHTRPNSPLGAIATQGRELGVALWAATQRPSRIPTFLMSEAEHNFVFKLRLPIDRKRLEDLMEQEEPDWSELPSDRAFYYYSIRRGLTGPYQLATRGVQDANNRQLSAV